MNDAEVRGLRTGDVLRETLNGHVRDLPPLCDVHHVGECVNERSGAHGHAFALVARPLGEGAKIHFTVESDEYTAGAGYRTHDAEGKRIKGFDLVQRG